LCEEGRRCVAEFPERQQAVKGSAEEREVQLEMEYAPEGRNEVFGESDEGTREIQGPC
jgi:hypothetical protein